MNDEVIADLKQFIAVTVTQQTVDIREDINKLDQKLSKKIDDLSNDVADALEANNQTTDKQFKDHEKRIVKLEHKAA